MIQVRKLTSEEFWLRIDVAEEIRMGDAQKDTLYFSAVYHWAQAGHYYGCLLDGRKPENYYRRVPDNTEVYGEDDYYP